MKLLKYMSYKQLKNIILFFSVCALFTCSKGDDNSQDPTPVVNDPTAATLVFPNVNSECTEGTSITSTESTVKFQWNKGNYTDSYNLKLKDLNTGTTTGHSTVENNISIKLKRGNPYSWSVVSRSNESSKTAESPVWKFFNAGEGISSYAPFPAEAVSPIRGADVASGNITLEWSGSDVDNDIESYNVYFGETTSPAEYKTEITETILNNVIVGAGKTYYWRVKTIDTQGNVSNSDIFSFKGS
ncbi:hypothetical protein [Wocania ichthyoenteri]|uniref:hypothetical protein n=1 Tax=Wocania ichthyoenteri TaxID=1230531 RepID=UPI000691CEAD|nr:hypothetical protein [Wocania ichthyoenteri]